MKFQDVPIPVGVENVDPSAMAMLGGVAVAALLVAVSAPRLFALLAMVAGGIAGGFMIA